MIRVVVADLTLHDGIVKVARTTKYTTAAGNIMFTSPIHYAKGWVYAALDEEEVVGFACVRHMKRRPETNVYFVGVSPARRSQGIGELLMHMIALNSPLERIALKVAKDNPRARSFYERMGFWSEKELDDDEYWHLCAARQHLQSAAKT